MLFNKYKRSGRSFITLMVAVVVLGIPSTFAQTYLKEPLNWGIKAGMNTSDFNGEDTVNSEVREDFSGGIFLNYRFNGRWALQPEFIFNKKGADLEPGLTGENGMARYEFGYLNIPVLAKLYIPVGSLLSPNLYAGPEIGLKVYGESNNSDIDGELKDNEFGLAFGAGLDINVGSSPENLLRTVGLDVRYSLGLTNVFDNTPQVREARNTVLFAAFFLGF